MNCIKRNALRTSSTHTPHAEDDASNCFLFKIRLSEEEDILPLLRLLFFIPFPPQVQHTTDRIGNRINFVFSSCSLYGLGPIG